MNFDQDNARFDDEDAFDDPLLDSRAEFEVEIETPFGSLGRRRWLLMAVVVLGGAAAVITMKLFAGAPTAAVANPAMDLTMDKFVRVEAQTTRVSLADNSSFIHLLDTDVERWQVPLRDLRANPFRAFNTDAGRSSGTAFGPRDADAASRALQRRLDSMIVSMVIRGTITVALVDGVRMPVGQRVRTDDGLEATLIAVGDHSLEVELADPSTQAVLRGMVRIVPRDPSP